MAITKNKDNIDSLKVPNKQADTMIHRFEMKIMYSFLIKEFNEFVAEVGKQNAEGYATGIGAYMGKANGKATFNIGLTPYFTDVKGERLQDIRPCQKNFFLAGFLLILLGPKMTNPFLKSTHRCRI